MTDKRYLIELRGGRMDGDRFRRNRLSSEWIVPEIVAPELVTDEDGLFRPERLPVAVYRQTGIVTADGAHVYQFAGVQKGET